MEVITIDGQQFVKASAAARQAGYTADYVGQLARTGSVPARLVGRTWYVDVETLRTHRVEKKRAARVKAREQVKRAVEEKRALEAAREATEGSTRLKKTVAVYDTDEGELMPRVAKKEPTDAISAPTTPVAEESITASDAPRVTHSDDEYTPVNIVVSTSAPSVTDDNEVEHAPQTVAVQTSTQVKGSRQVIAPRKRVAAVSLSTEKQVTPRPKLLIPTRRPLPTKVNRTRSSKSSYILPFLVLILPALIIGAALPLFEVHNVYTRGGEAFVNSIEYVLNLGPVLEVIQRYI